ncbi:MAG: hypothetical protein EB141_20880 [Verrucomicrobia bacterium]|nr:hypothetical protein [Verrucomicrobiota bacterium]
MLLGIGLRIFRAASLSVAEEKTHARRAAFTPQPQRVVLVVAGKPLVPRAALADDVNLLPLFDGAGGDPRLHRDGVALGKLHHALRTGVFHADELTLPIEACRRAVWLELGKLITRLGALTDGDLAFDDAVKRHRVSPGR